jgi:PAS domain S-box-containing protein
MKLVAMFNALLRRHRVMRVAVAGTLTLIVGGLLVFTIYFTRFELEWVAFLAGVLFAAVLALASQVSKAEWLVARRTKQLERMRERVNQETIRGKATEEGLRLAEMRNRMVCDAVPDLVLFIDREQRCRYHNHAAERWTGLPAELIDGKQLRDLLGTDAYLAAASRFQQSLRGKSLDYEMPLAAKTGKRLRFTARQIPYPPQGEPEGFYLILTRVTATEPAVAAAEPGLADVPPPDARDTGAENLMAPRDTGESLYVNSMTEQFMGEEDPRAKLMRALQDDEFLLFAQKIMPVRADLPEPDCYEVLLRLKEEEENMLPPGGFIPIAERYGLMEDIDRWVIRSLVGWCITRQRSLPDWRPPMFCVNLSDVSIGNPAFARFARGELQRPGFPGRALCFEIGEAELLERNDDVRHFVNALKPAGCHFTIDGFGGLKVSFAHLRDLPVDFLKINGMIIQNMLKAPTEFAKVRAIRTVCDKTGIRTIAEWVETPETLLALKDIGIDYAQGFGVAGPQPLDTLLEQATR